MLSDMKSRKQDLANARGPSTRSPAFPFFEPNAAGGDSGSPVFLLHQNSRQRLQTASLFRRSPNPSPARQHPAEAKPKEGSGTVVKVKPLAPSQPAILFLAPVF
jgi:hypothetical protein